MPDMTKGWLNKPLSPQAILLACCLIGYWPLSFGLFSVKNDAIHYFLPFRYNISCAIRSFELPLWSPFVYMGTPLHADMQSGAWNPFVWLLSIWRPYDLTLFHIETLIYIYISGLGIFQLSQNFSNNQRDRLLISISYMLCGYMMGSAQFINWLATAAFLPFVLHYYYKALKTADIKDGMLTALFSGLLLVCGYPADFIYTFYILLFMLSFAIISHPKATLAAKWKRYIWLHVLMVICFLGLTAPAISSYFSLLPFYERGSGTSLLTAFENAYTPNNFISLLNPLPTWTPAFSTSTDPTGRNIFIGIIPLTLFLVSLYRVEKRDIAILIVLAGSALFTLGDGYCIRRFAYEILPGMDTFRHPSHFRLYVIICLLSVACNASGKYEGANYVRLFTKTTWILAALCIVVSLGLLAFYHSEVSFDLPVLSRSGIKYWLSNISFYEALIGGLLLQGIFLLAALPAIKTRHHSKYLLTLSFMNMFAFQSLFPVTAVSQKPPKVINKLIRQQDIRIDMNALTRTLQDNDVDKQKVNDDIRLFSLYNKKITLTRQVYSPSTMSSLNDFLISGFMYDFVAGYPVVYFAQKALPVSDTVHGKPDSCRSRIVFLSKAPPLLSKTHCDDRAVLRVIDAGYNFFKLEVKSSTQGYLVLSQNYHPAWVAMIDGHSIPIQKSNLAFMSIPIEDGTHKITWRYSPWYIYPGIIITLATLGAMALFYIRKLSRQSPLSAVS